MSFRGSQNRLQEGIGVVDLTQPGKQNPGIVAAVRLYCCIIRKLSNLSFAAVGIILSRKEDGHEGNFLYCKKGLTINPCRNRVHLQESSLPVARS